MACGETAIDVAYEAMKGDAKSVTMCFRTGFLSFPKALSRFKVFGKQFKGGLPIDGLITNHHSRRNGLTHAHFLSE